MIIFLGGGRLGNQIFQYLFLKRIRRGNEKIIVWDFEDILKVFEISDLITISRKHRYLKILIFRILYPVIKFSFSLRLISTVEVEYDDLPGFENEPQRRESTTYIEKKGLLKFIRYIKSGFFQSEYFLVEEIVKTLKLKSCFNEKAEEFLKDVSENSHKVFVHIRRGDYKEITILGKSALLPIEYYKNLIDYFINIHNNCCFIFLSDEPEIIEQEFKYIVNKKIARNNDPGTDFAIIGKCKSGILSTSTFGWWAAYMIKDKGTIFAPKYWLGFNSKIEFPKGGFPSFAKPVEI
jgi:hypothetical protein